ncbi:MAG TPA: DUF1385 domain-containing protein [Acidimicrobiia bacterium]|jgi:uncharacterized protein YqhQ
MPSPPPENTVGGQAVIEGVMMRAPTAWAVAVRRPDGTIEAVRHPLPRLSARSRAARIPFIRGVMVLWESLTLGFRSLSWSAQKSQGEEEEPLTSRQLAASMVLALVVFLAIFVLVPAAVAGAMTRGSDAIFSLVEAVLRLGLFVGYLWLLGRSGEIQRVFAYHGAEHMAIHAYEGGRDLSVESVAKFPPQHPRCGTSFLLIVVLGSILVFSFLGRPDWPILILSRLIGIPVIAGVAYEILRFSGRRQSDLLGRVLAAPGLWLQRLTTRVPAEDQIEVAVTSLLSALDDEAATEVMSRGPVPPVATAARAR